MSLDTIIRHRTQEKELLLAGSLAMTRNEWLAKGGIYRGTLGEAKQQDYYTIYLIKKDGKRYVPCVPVFFREIN